jgi:hypothetical protein
LMMQQIQRARSPFTDTSTGEEKTAGRTGRGLEGEDEEDEIS